jgi:aldehyde dehydrogenase (NAD+)
VAIANDSDYGLTGAVYTADRALGLRIARQVRTGRMHVNNWVYTERGPFGGYKSSGIGRTWGRFGVDEYSEVKLVCWR